MFEQYGQTSLNQFWSNERRTLGFQHFLHCRRTIYPLRLQDEYVFVMCLHGAIRVTESGVCTRIGANEIFAGNSWCWRSSEYGTEGQCQGLALIVSPRLLPPGIIFEPIRAAQALRRLADEVLIELSGNQPGKNEMLEALAREFLVRVTRVFRQQPGQVVPQGKRLLPRRQFVQALDYMQSCRKDSFGIDKLSNLIGVAPGEFSRLFRESTGKTPLVVYNQLLISRAELALQDSASIKEVAFDLGFQSPSHFTALYRKVKGYRPSAARIFRT
jgi:AraC-like DNA-binding protein